MIMQEKKKRNKPYFTKETEEAIIRFNQSDSELERNKIYQEHIHKAFDKLAENIIRTFKFTYFDDSYDDVKKSVVSFLNEKIMKYKQTNGKAFSYFSIVAKNFLIGQNNSNYAIMTKTHEVDVVDNYRNIQLEISREDYLDEQSSFMDTYIQYVDKNLANLFDSKTDIQIADSVLEIFRTRNSIEDFNKKALYIMIRDRSNAKTEQVTKVVSKMKDLYKKLYNQYLIDEEEPVYENYISVE